MNDFLVRGGSFGHRQRQTEDGHVVETDTEIGVTLPQAKECLRPPETRRGKEASFSRSFRGSMALPSVEFQTSCLQNCERIHLCYVKPLGLWYLVTTAPGNRYGAYRKLFKAYNCLVSHARLSSLF